jgi:hypothetical protein
MYEYKILQNFNGCYFNIPGHMHHPWLHIIHDIKIRVKYEHVILIELRDGKQ